MVWRERPVVRAIALRGMPCAANARIRLLIASRVTAASHWIRSALLKITGSTGISGENALRSRGSSDRTAAGKAVEAFSNRCQRTATSRVWGAATAAADPVARAARSRQMIRTYGFSFSRGRIVSRCRSGRMSMTVRRSRSTTMPP